VTTPFIYAEELKQRFQVKAYFYRLIMAKQQWLCRSLLEIEYLDDAIQCSEQERKTEGFEKGYDALIIMMNPGSARPIQQDVNVPSLSRRALFDLNAQRPMITVKPDSAQYQLMRLMELRVWQRIRLINLSDLCEGNSRVFADRHKELDRFDRTHPESILHHQRRAELNAIIESVGVVIVAWGTQPVLKVAAQTMLGLLRDPLGLSLQAPWYRFASPYRKDHKLHWLAQINRLIDQHKAGQIAG